MRKKKVAIIGGGQVAEKNHVPNYRDFSDIEVVAVLNQRETSAREFAERNDIPESYTDLNKMLTLEKPEMVSVCTPNKFHYGHVMAALNAGCHVLCEKPPGISAQEAKEMNEMAQKQKRVLAYNFQHRFSCETTFLKQKVSEGILGDVYYSKVSALRRSGIPGWGNFINKDLQGGGPLIDLGIHMIDSAFYMMGFPEVQKVTAKKFQKIGPYKSEGTFGKWDPQQYEVEDSLFGFIELVNGGLIQVDTSFALHMKKKNVMNVELFGDKAGASLYPFEVYTDQAGEFISLFKGTKDTGDSARKSIISFVNRCSGNHDKMIASSEEGYKIQSLIEALYQSADTGESIYL